MNKLFGEKTKPIMEKKPRKIEKVIITCATKKKDGSLNKLGYYVLYNDGVMADSVPVSKIVFLKLYTYYKIETKKGVKVNVINGKFLRTDTNHIIADDLADVKECES